ncbi:MAG: site-specific recombinase [Neolewinella sp.]|jgi:site-specific recombinase
MYSLSTTLDKLTALPAKPDEALHFLVRYFRTSYQRTGEITTAFRVLEQALETSPHQRLALAGLINTVINDYHFFSFFSQYSLLDEGGFGNGIWSRIKNKLIPQLPEETDIQFLINRTLDLKLDPEWIALLPKDAINRLFGAQGFLPYSQQLTSELTIAIQALAIKISGFGMDHRVSALFQKLELDVAPFQKLQEVLSGDLEHKNIREAQQLLGTIYLSITSLRLRKKEIGTTLKLTYESRKVLAKLAILKDLLILRTDSKHVDSWAKVLQNSLKSELSRRSISTFINGHLDLVSLEIVEHTAKTGEKYIAENKLEYYSIFRSSMLGGLLIALFAAGKLYLDSLQVGELPEALLFSLNYAACFVLVKTFGGIIATKQPAMVASTIIKNIDQHNNFKLSSLVEIINLIKKASRSQFISFVGNLSVAFPLAVGIYWLTTHYFGWSFIGPEKTAKLLKSIWPFAGGAIAFAAIAGIFLSLSGLISGYFDNKVIASNLQARLVEHPLLKGFLPLNRRTTLATYLCNNLGALSGNISLGFFLGMAGFLGFITGLPIDIRHIAFSSANFGFAFLAANLTDTEILLGALSILLIGAINFAVSFGITLYLTLKSRGISFVNTFKLLLFLVKEILLKPWTFLFAPPR